MSFRQMKQRGCLGTKFVGPAQLYNYKLVFAGNSPNWEMLGTADIRKSPNSVVWGGLFMVTNYHLELLDTFEHAPERRERRAVTVIHQYSEYSAEVYTLKDDCDLVEPSRGYISTVLGGSIDCRLPIGYISTLKDY